MDIESVQNAVDTAGEFVLRNITKVATSRYRLLCRASALELAFIHAVFVVAGENFLDDTAEYYKALQSFALDFDIDLVATATSAIENKSYTSLHNSFSVTALYKKMRSTDSNLMKYLFFESCEFNPYLAYYRGSLSAYTVVTNAIAALQLSLAAKLLEEECDIYHTYTDDIQRLIFGLTHSIE